MKISNEVSKRTVLLLLLLLLLFEFHNQSDVCEVKRVIMTKVVDFGLIG